MSIVPLRTEDNPNFYTALVAMGLLLNLLFSFQARPTIQVQGVSKKY
jgi:hypothetical protein